MNHPPQDDVLLAELAQRTLDRCEAAAAFTEEPGRITRTFCSSAMADLHVALRDWMEAAGLTCRVDAAGNLFGRLESPLLDNAQTLLIGSHLDSVPNAGRYDGVLGVMLGLALVEAVQRSDLRLPFALEVVGFSEEEGVRYGVPFIGSRALVGDCDEALLQRKDANGVSVAEALGHFSCDAAQIQSCELPAKKYVAYLEPHIEQGPVLESEDQPLSIVTAIAGQTRAAVRFVGAAGHAGTVPMELRKDALCAAAEWIIEVEKAAQQTLGLVATVGTIEVSPGAGNVIPGEARLRLDIRHTDDKIRQAAVEHLIRLGKDLQQTRNIEFQFTTAHEHSAVAMDAAITTMLKQGIAAAGHRTMELPSGAGHDAAVMARRWPSAMLFIRCRGGVSHHPDEAVTLADVTAALTAIWHFGRRLNSKILSDYF
ncbi:allantoate amidohydrolase [Anatilimnocola floriformis]|uniref:allantoate amidohydrolase n=1 Tax=Anatilimnocola floriformis TaxID=2948575 RepID=UPI0020C45364|nr:allantoate amidohydrolase [Anatilimnocola floriformis]